MLKFILNIFCDVIHDVFIKHVYNIVRDKLSTFCVLMYSPSLNLKTALHNSLHLNRVDYSIWGALQQLVYWQQGRDIEHLKDVLVISWEQISQACIDRAIGQFQKRLASIIAAKGSHVEHFFD